MANTMPTGRPVAERTFKYGLWVVEELENGKGYNFIAPLKHKDRGEYVFSFAKIQDALDFIVAAVGDGEIIHNTQLGDKHYVDEGRICVWMPDTWINRRWSHNDEICTLQAFVNIVLIFVERQWITTNP